MTVHRRIEEVMKRPESLWALKNRDDGFTLVEVIAVLSLLIVISLTTWNTFRSATTEVQISIWETDLDASLRKAILRIAGELADSGNDVDGTEYVVSHPRTASTSLDSVDFHQRIALTSVPATDWGTTVSYQLFDSPGEVNGNGIDDNNNGMVDEQMLVRIQDGQEVVIASGVSSFAVIRNSGEDFVTVQLTIVRPNVNDMPQLTRTLATTVALRNREQM